MHKGHGRATRRAFRSIAVVLVAAAALPASAVAAGCPGAGTNPNRASATTINRATLCLLNRERSRRHLPRLRSNSRLSAAAARHARDMVQRKYFSHDTLGGGDFLDRIERTSYLDSARNWNVGENIAWGSGRYATPASIMSGWMHSHGHRANILNRSFREVGLGLALGAPEPGVGNAATYVNDFGKRG